jgi:1,4-dihydroxy-2-naphthoyl-CoA hydrolase
MFTFNTFVRLPDTDAAGILFFGNYFRLAHDAYETFMESIGFGLDYVIREADFLIVIAHAEADYNKPLQLGEKLTVQLTVEKISQTSFALSYVFKDKHNDTAAVVKTVHVTVDKKTGEKIVLPEKLRAKLAGLR